MKKFALLLLLLFTLVKADFVDKDIEESQKELDLSSEVLDLFSGELELSSLDELAPESFMEEDEISGLTSLSNENEEDEEEEEDDEDALSSLDEEEEEEDEDALSGLTSLSNENKEDAVKDFWQRRRRRRRRRRRCDANCGSGKYRTGCNDNSGGSCPSCASCSKGYYRSGCGSKSAGSCRSCPSCPGGQYRSGCSGRNSGTCRSCTSCPGGQYRSGCSRTSPGTCRGCRSCPGGKYLSGCSFMSSGTCTGCTSCPDGTSLSGCSGRNGPGTCTETHTVVMASDPQVLSDHCFPKVSTKSYVTMPAATCQKYTTDSQKLTLVNRFLTDVVEASAGASATNIIGDLTEYGWLKEKNMFSSMIKYQPKFHLSLGNHDIINNINNCNTPEWTQKAKLLAKEIEKKWENDAKDIKKGCSNVKSVAKAFGCAGKVMGSATDINKIGQTIGLGLELVHGALPGAANLAVGVTSGVIDLGITTGRTAVTNTVNTGTTAVTSTINTGTTAVTNLFNRRGRRRKSIFGRRELKSIEQIATESLGKNGCTQLMYEYGAEVALWNGGIRDTKSINYYYDIRNFRYINLQNGPFKTISWNSKKGDFAMKQQDAINFFKNKVTDACAKGMHGIFAMWHVACSHTEPKPNCSKEKPDCDYKTYCDARQITSLKNWINTQNRNNPTCRVLASFHGHIHSHSGPYSETDIADKVPSFKCGGGSRLAFLSTEVDDNRKHFKVYAHTRTDINNAINKQCISNGNLAAANAACSYYCFNGEVSSNVNHCKSAYTVTVKAHTDKVAKAAAVAAAATRRRRRRREARRRRRRGWGRRNLDDDDEELLSDDEDQLENDDEDQPENEDEDQLENEDEDQLENEPSSVDELELEKLMRVLNYVESEQN